MNIKINEDNIILLNEYSFLSYSITHDITPDNINSSKRIGRIAQMIYM